MISPTTPEKIRRVFFHRIFATPAGKGCKRRRTTERPLARWTRTTRSASLARRGSPPQPARKPPSADGLEFSGESSAAVRALCEVRKRRLRFATSGTGETSGDRGWIWEGRCFEEVLMLPKIAEPRTAAATVVRPFQRCPKFDIP